MLCAILRTVLIRFFSWCCKWNKRNVISFQLAQFSLKLLAPSLVCEISVLYFYISWWEFTVTGHDASYAAFRAEFWQINGAWHHSLAAFATKCISILFLAFILKRKMLVLGNAEAGCFRNFKDRISSKQNLSSAFMSVLFVIAWFGTALGRTGCYAVVLEGFARLVGCRRGDREFCGLCLLLKSCPHLSPWGFLVDGVIFPPLFPSISELS